MSIHQIIEIEMSNGERPWPFMSTYGWRIDEPLPVYFQLSERLVWRYYNALTPVAGKLRDAYGGGMPPGYKPLDLVLRPGLSLLLIMSASYFNPPSFLGCGPDEDVPTSDPIESPRKYRPTMVQYEKQIPLQVLEAIVSVHRPDLREEPSVVYKFVVELILGFFSMPPFEEEQPGCLHILDVLRRSILQDRRLEVKRFPNIFYENPPVIPSAKQLLDARIGIKLIRRKKSLTGISFNNKTLCLPLLSLDTVHELLLTFQNIIRFERFDPNVQLYFSSYVYFMSELLRDTEDCNLLKNCGIINTTKNDITVVEMFRTLRSGSEGTRLITMPMHPHVMRLGSEGTRHITKPMHPHLMKLGHRLRERYNRNSEEWRQDLYQKYLNTPWGIISLFAAFLILSLTVIQTVYTVLGYYKPK